MKTHLIQVKCDNCSSIVDDAHELHFTLGRKSWVSDICTSCEPEIIKYMEGLGMGGPQARNATAVPKGNAKTPSPKLKGGSKCTGCNERFASPGARKIHSTRKKCGQDLA